MCGYCSELIILNNNFESNEEDNDFKFLSFQDLILYQEQEIFSNKQHVFAIQRQDYTLLFGKLYEKFITTGYNQELIDSIFLPCDLFNKFKSSTDKSLINPVPTLVARLKDVELYKSPEKWDAFIESDDLAKQTKQLLEYYCFNGVKVADEKIDNPINTLDGFEILTASTENSFHIIDSLTSSIIFSLEFLFKNGRWLDCIEIIALGYPKSCPGPMAYELWIQRKAFVMCLKRKGISFILDNVEKIRGELIYYGLMKVQFSNSELFQLKKMITEYPPTCDINMMYLKEKDLVELIDHKRFLIK